MECATSEYQSYAEYFDHGPQREFVTRNRLCGTAEISVSQVAGNPAGEYTSPQLPEFLLIVCGPGSYGMRYDLGQGWRQGRFRKGDLLLAAPNVSNEYHTDAVTNFGTIALPMSFVSDDRIGHDFAGKSDFGILHERSFRDKSIEQHAQMILRSAESSDPVDALYVDQAAITLLELFAGKAERASISRRRQMRLDQRTLQTIMDYIEANLHTEVALLDLASLAEFSVAYFARAFQLTVGTAPYAYILSRRIQRAKESLAGTARPLADVALECGFSSQAHLTSVFSKTVGTTPGRFRKSVHT